MSFLDDMTNAGPPRPPDDDDEGLSVSIGARLVATLGSLDATLARRRIQRPPMQPVFYMPGDVIAATETGVALIDLGGPDMGHVWYVRSLVVGGVAPSTVTPGQADVFVSTSELGGTTGLIEPSLLMWRDRATRLPNVAFYSAEEVVVKATEHLVVRFSGCTSGQILTASGRVTDYQEGVYPQAWDR